MLCNIIFPFNSTKARAPSTGAVAGVDWWEGGDRSVREEIGGVFILRGSGTDHHGSKYGIRNLDGMDL